MIVDDGSRDGTPDAMAELAAADPRVKVVTLSRNFGHQAALTAALEHASGDVVVMLDGDLQDPPELIPEMLDRWRDGVDVVYAVRSRAPGRDGVQARDRERVLPAVPPPGRHRPRRPSPATSG